MKKIILLSLVIGCVGCRKHEPGSTTGVITGPTVVSTPAPTCGVGNLPACPCGGLLEPACNNPRPPIFYCDQYNNCYWG